MKTPTLALMLLALSSFLNQAQAQGNLVINGAFDGTAAEWTLANGATWGATGNPTPAVGLVSEIPSPIADPTASQTVNSLTPANVYLISGDFERGKDRGGGTPEDLSFGVALDGIFWFQSVLPDDLQWHSFSFFYTATSSSTVLSLSSQINGTGVEYRIDNISMREVPEPSFASLFGLGCLLAGGAGCGRRRKFRSLE